MNLSPKTPKDIDDDLTLDDFLGGGLKLWQPKGGYRIGVDTILLAASVPAKEGDKILEAGTGSGGAALALAQRVSGVSVTGLELQFEMASIARKNILENKLENSVDIIEGDITSPPSELVENSFDHVMVNPPYLEPGSAISPPSITKSLAHMNSSAELKDWVMFCLSMAKNKGTLSFVFRADRLHDLMALLHRRVGDLIICPLWPREGVVAKRILVQGKKGLRGVTTMAPGIALHGEIERYTREAEAILRLGQKIDMEGARSGAPLVTKS